MTTILDIGPGIRPQRGIPGTTLCCEPCAEYADILAANGHLVVRATWAEAIDLFPPLSFDHVTLLDIVEHVEKAPAVRLLADTLPLARVSVHVYTPEGFYEQEPGADGLDAWGLHGGEWQRHRSGWTVEDFPGWSVERIQVDGKPTMLKAIWRR